MKDQEKLFLETKKSFKFKSSKQWNCHKSNKQSLFLLCWGNVIMVLGGV